MLTTHFFKKSKYKKVKSILGFQKWTKINVQNRKVQKSFENQYFFFKLLLKYIICNEQLNFLIIKINKAQDAL